MVWSIFYEAKRHPRHATEFSELQSNPEHPQQNLKDQKMEDTQFAKTGQGSDFCGCGIVIE